VIILKWYEKRRRTLIKALIYRPISSLITFLVLFLLTGSIKEMTIYSIIIEVTKAIWYFSYDRIWNIIQKGKYSKI